VSAVVGTCANALFAPLAARIMTAPRMVALTPDLVGVLDDIFRTLPITRAPGT
jgi:hypothetical protein